MHDVEVTVGKLKDYALSLNWTNPGMKDNVVDALDPNRANNQGSYYIAYLRMHGAIARMYDAVVMQKTLANLIGAEPSAIVKFYDFMQELGIDNDTLEVWRQKGLQDAGLS